MVSELKNLVWRMGKIDRLEAKRGYRTFLIHCVAHGWELYISEESDQALASSTHLAELLELAEVLAPVIREGIK